MATFCEEYLKGNVYPLPEVMTLELTLESISSESFFAAEAALEKCDNRLPYVVYPVSRDKTDNIQMYLDRIGGIGYETTRSVVDGLVLFWSIQLTKTQAALVKGHNQVNRKSSLTNQTHPFLGAWGEPGMLRQLFGVLRQCNTTGKHDAWIF